MTATSTSPLPLALNASPSDSSRSIAFEIDPPGAASYVLSFGRLECRQLRDIRFLKTGEQPVRVSASRVRLPFISYSSLEVLRAFPFDRIKLDASFVAEIEHSEQAIGIPAVRLGAGYQPRHAGAGLVWRHT